MKRTKVHIFFQIIYARSYTYGPANDISCFAGETCSDMRALDDCVFCPLAGKTVVVMNNHNKMPPEIILGEHPGDGAVLFSDFKHQVFLICSC